MNKLYKFRDLSLKDQMCIEVDFGGEPVEIDEEEIDNIIYHSFRHGSGSYSAASITAAKAIKQLLT